MKTLSVTRAARNFHSYLKLVHDGHDSFEVVRNRVPYARLVPAEAVAANTHDLAEDLSKVALSAEDRRALAAAVRVGRAVLDPLKNPWG